MIIRHDLKIVFLHVPKCAGKQLRCIFKTTKDKSFVEELWNYEYNKYLERYVDMAHLPMSDLRHYPQFSYLDEYRVIACVRNPYMRLASAANEYYRQKSKMHESIINEGKITTEMKERYYKMLKKKHIEQDPRFIHSQPMYKFTHYGREPKVDYLLRCETLKNDIENLAEELEWPEEIKNIIPRYINSITPENAKIKPSSRELELAETLYKDDLETFGYQNKTKNKNGNTNKSASAGEARKIHRCDSVEWHWGPRAFKGQTSMEPIRKKW